MSRQHDQTDFMGLLTVVVIINCVPLPAIHTLYFIQVVVFFFGKQVRVSIFSGDDFSNKKGFEPAFITNIWEAPVMGLKHFFLKKLDTINISLATQCSI